MSANTNVNRPLQRLSWEDKKKDNYLWFRECIEGYLGASSFKQIEGINYIKNDNKDRNAEIDELVGVYHNDIPAKWFTHITNPLALEKGGKNKQYLPAKIRPLNILKTNIDLLISSYRKRPLLYTVVNNDEDAYNNYVEAKKQYKEKVFRERFIQIVKTPEGQEVPQDTTPEDLLARFELSYKDNLADKAQKYLDKKIVSQYDLHEKFHNLFKDYIIYGEPVSFRTVENGKLVYKRIDRRYFDYDKTGDKDYIEDVNWATHVQYVGLNDIVDRFYPILTDEDWKTIESNNTYSPTSFRDYLYNKNNKKDYGIPVYHVVWKGFKKIGILYTIDENGMPTTLEVDENYIPQEYEQVEWKWVNQLYHGNRIGKDLYLNLGEFPYAVSEADLLVSTKLPYNGITFANKYEKVFSPLKVGVPFLIMYLICNYIAEKMLSKHKGKIILIDYNVIPKKNGWTEDKFMQYAEALGYMFIDRSAPGADTTFNQYTSIDAGTLDQVQNLFALSESYIRQWDRMIGINDAAKGQQIQSAQVGTTQAAIVQSSIAIDYIFQKFEDFQKRELQYTLELSKYITLEGANLLLERDDYGVEVLQIERGEFFAPLGIKVVDSSTEIQNLRDAKEYAKAVNQYDPLAMIEILTSNNISGLKKELKEIRLRTEKVEQGKAQQEQETQLALKQAERELILLEKQLDIEHLNAEYDRKEEIEFIKGDIALQTSSTLNTTGDDNKGADIYDIMNRSADRASNERIKDKELGFKERELQAKERMNQDNNRTALKNKTVSGK